VREWEEARSKKYTHKNKQKQKQIEKQFTRMTQLNNNINSHRTIAVIVR